MHFLKTFKTQTTRGLSLAAAALTLVGIAASINQDLLGWTWARPSQVDKGLHAFRQADSAFQTLSDFIKRSPGERGEIDSLKGVFTKDLGSQEDRSSAIPRSQRALGKVFDPDPLTIDAAQQGPLQPLALPFTDVAIFNGPIPLDQTITGSSGLSTTANTIPGSVIFGPNGPSSPGGGGGDNPTRPPVSAVPEPSAWALLLVGFFGAGSTLRRKKTKSHNRRQTVGL